MLFCTGLLFLATQRPGAHWNLGGQSRSDGVQNIRAVMGRGRARLGTSCQIIPFCWTQTCSVTSRFGVTALRPLHASMEAPPCRLGCEESPSPQLHLVQALLWCLPASFTLLCLVLSCVFSLSALSSGCSDRCPGFKQHAAVLNGSVTSDSCAAPQDCNPPGSQSVGFPRQEYGGWLPFPSPVDLPGPGIQPTSLALARGF